MCDLINVKTNSAESVSQNNTANHTMTSLVGAISSREGVALFYTRMVDFADHYLSGQRKEFVKLLINHTNSKYGTALCVTSREVMRRDGDMDMFLREIVRFCYCSFDSGIVTLTPAPSCAVDLLESYDNYVFDQHVNSKQKNTTIGLCYFGLVASSITNPVFSDDMEHDLLCLDVYLAKKHVSLPFRLQVREYMLGGAVAPSMEHPDVLQATGARVPQITECESGTSVELVHPGTNAVDMGEIPETLGRKRKAQKEDEGCAEPAGDAARVKVMHNGTLQHGGTTMLQEPPLERAGVSTKSGEACSGHACLGHASSGQEPPPSNNSGHLVGGFSVVRRASDGRVSCSMKGAVFAGSWQFVHETFVSTLNPLHVCSEHGCACAMKRAHQHCMVVRIESTAQEGTRHPHS